MFIRLRERPESLPKAKNIMSQAGAAMGKTEPAIVALVLAGLAAVAMMPSIRGVDGTGNYVYVSSILRDGDLNFANDYAAFDHAQGYQFDHASAPIHPETGLPANRYGIGAAIFWAPAVAIVHGILSFAAPELATGTSRPYEWAVALASAWWGGLGLWLLYVRLRENFSSAVAALTIAGMTLATPLGFYLWMHGSMSHAVGFFVAVMAMLQFEKAVASPRLAPALLCGLWAGLLVITRFQDVTWTLALGVAIALFRTGAPEASDGGNEIAAEVGTPPGGKIPLVLPMTQRALGALAFGLGVALAFAPQMGVWKILYGSWLSGPLPYFDRGAGSLTWWPRHLIEILLSERGGVLAWHPILAIALVGLIAARRAGVRPLVRTASIGLALQLYLLSCWSVWWAGASFGNRFFISAFPWLALGLAALIDRLRSGRRPWLAIALIAVLVAWNAGLLVQYGAEMVPREDAVGWGVVLRNQFVEVPRWLLGWAGLIPGP